jgi:hypothetical protein
MAQVRMPDQTNFFQHFKIAIDRRQVQGRIHRLCVTQNLFVRSVA